MSSRTKRDLQEKGVLFHGWKRVLLIAILPFVGGVVGSILYLYPTDSSRVKSPENIRVQSEEEEKILAESLMEEEEAVKFLDEDYIRGKISLVLDDVGYERDRALKFIDMGVPVTVAILPGGAYSRELAELSRRRGYTVILHMPMQSDQNVSDKSSDYLLRVEMGEKEVIQRLDRAFSWVPGAGGISNHMGSRFTKDSGGMRYVALYLKKKKLFFLDSRTTAQTVAPFVFRVSGVRYASRDIFIDNENDPDVIRNKFEELKAVASQAGSGVGILHPSPLAVEMVEELVRESLLEGYRFVTLSEIVNGS